MRITFHIITVGLTFLVFACVPNKDIFISKGNNSSTATIQNMVYALPQTVLNITLETEKVIIKKGPYAQYAAKYLALEGVPTLDSVYWRISKVKIESKYEADPKQYYTISFHSYPENIQRLFEQSNKGLVLNLPGSWNTFNSTIPNQDQTLAIIDPSIIDETIKEKTDTLYKTVLTDSTLVKIPIIKKKILIKTEDELAKETAHELLKTRKRKLKTLRGEYEYHPNGEALQVMINELNKKEKQYYELFAGKTIVQKFHKTYAVIPQTDQTNVTIGYFSESLGVSNEKNGIFAPITLSLIKEQDLPQGLMSENKKNTIFFRVPITTTCTLKQGENVLTETRIPIYQFGQILPLVLSQ